MKKYKLPEENDLTDKLSEPAIEYHRTMEMKLSPPLTEEELNDCITTEELLESVYIHIDTLFDQRT
ncbi:MAG: hypothetical protein LUG98_16950 [Tannerellaceae bacterium]|nr:hypothetical protein [Tannerellaceae bacterium]